jgi:hypothetical protein
MIAVYSLGNHIGTTMPARINEKLDRIIQQKFTAAFMSNTKWRKLFTVLDRPEFNLQQAIWKFIDSDLEHRGSIPKSDDLLEKYVTEYDLLSPFAYKHIEWIELLHKGIPSGYEKVPFAHWHQDIAGVLTALNEAGVFEISETVRGIRIYGFK